MFNVVKERESMTDAELSETLSRLQVARLIQCIVLVLRASQTVLPAACWYAAKVFWACSRARKLTVSKLFHKVYFLTRYFIFNYPSVL